LLPDVNLNAISELAAGELRALAMALRSGRVALPCSSFSLQRVLGQGDKDGIAEWLNTIGVKGCSAEATASWLELFADSHQRRDATEQQVQVVSTAPAGDIAMHRDTAVVAQDLFRRATHSLLISTYGIFGGREIFRNLAIRMESNTELRVRLFLNIAGDVATANFAADFQRYQWPEGTRLPEIFYDVRSQDGHYEGETAVLHAKCIVMDGEEVLVTSANFTEAAHQRNIEVGLLVRSQGVARQVTQFFDGLVSAGWCAPLRLGD
jgi:phosphatidylserine/phosphatidylglycerophosphate/cardiolipin synthase-like enzyme